MRTRSLRRVRELALLPRQRRTPGEASYVKTPWVQTSVSFICGASESATELSRNPLRDLWLCVPASRRVCPIRLSAHRVVGPRARMPRRTFVQTPFRKDLLDRAGTSAAEARFTREADFERPRQAAQIALVGHDRTASPANARPSTPPHDGPCGPRGSTTQPRCGAQQPSWGSTPAVGDDHVRDDACEEPEREQTHPEFAVADAPHRMPDLADH